MRRHTSGSTSYLGHLGRGWRLLSVALVFAVALALVGQANAPTASAQAPEPVLEKLDALLRTLVEGSSTQIVNPSDNPMIAPATPPPGMSGSTRSANELEELATMIPLRLDGAVATVDVFMRTTADDAALTALGVTPLARVADIATARVPIGALGTLTAMPSVTRIEAARRIEPSNDVAIVESGAGLARTPLPGYDGSGVVVGIVDTGIDIFHQDFRNPDGTTRIRWLFDATEPGDFLGGTLYSEADINAELLTPGSTVSSRDTNGHGTHVAGSAVGDGSDDDTLGVFAGVAPRADIAVAKVLGPGAGSDADIFSGVVFIDAVGDALSQPWVANLSLGSQEGAHDGTTLFEEALDGLVGTGTSGKSIVVSAGNDGTRSVHASGTVPASPIETPVTAELNFEVSTPMSTAFFEIWYEGADDFRFGWVAPGGVTIPAALDLHPVGSDADDTWCVVFATGLNCVEVFHSPPLAANGDHQIFVRIYSEDLLGNPFLLLPGTWTFELEGDVVTGDGGFDAWSINPLQFDVPFTSLTDGSVRISSPASADDVIAVGAYGTKPDLGESVGPATTFSSPGPTRDARLKPEIVAPGSAIFSSFSADAPGDFGIIAPGGLHVAIQGTSMAAPMVSGAVALLLQADATLDAIEIRDLLIATAREDAFTGGAGSGWDAKTGNGKLDIHAALAELLETDAANSTVDVADSEVLADGVATTTVTVTLLDDGGNPVLGSLVVVNDAPDTATITPIGETTTGADGVVRFSVSSSSAGLVTFTGADDTDGVGINDTAEVTFTTTASEDATLSDLTVLPGALDPVFAPGTLSYTVNVANEVLSIDVTAETADSGATLEIDGNPADSGVPLTVDNLVVGANAFDIDVLAEDGLATETYTVTVTRAAPGPSSDATLSALAISEGTLDPAFNPATPAYGADVANGITSVDVTATANDAAATFTINGSAATNGVPEAVALAVGPNPIEVVVTAEDGAATETYTVTVTRAAPGPSTDATLAALGLSEGTLAPAFAPGTFAYTASVANAVTSVDVTATANDDGAGFEIAGTPAADGVPETVALAVGAESDRGGSHRRGRHRHRDLHGHGNARRAAGRGRRDAIRSVAVERRAQSGVRSGNARVHLERWERRGVGRRDRDGQLRGRIRGDQRGRGHDRPARRGRERHRGGRDGRGWRGYRDLHGHGQPRRAATAAGSGTAAERIRSDDHAESRGDQRRRR